MLGQNPRNTLEHQMLILVTKERPKSMSDWISGKLPMNPAFERAMDESEKTLLNEMLDQIQKLAISDVRNSVYDQIWEKLG